MPQSIRQQIVISGVGGQGVLFVTRLLAEAAIDKGLSVFTSETHGMAQRGGTVVSHLKVGNFSSPLIRPFEADGILALKAENIAQHGSFLKPGAWAVVNSVGSVTAGEGIAAFHVDADTLARKIGNPKAVNLITLGYALAVASKNSDLPNKLFCSLEEITHVIESRLASKKDMLTASLKAIEAGYHH